MAKPIDVLVLASRFEVRGSSTQTLNIAEHMPKLVIDSNESDTSSAATADADQDAAPSSAVEPLVRVRVVCCDDSRLSHHQRQAIDSEAIRPLRWPIVGRLLRHYLLSSVFASPPDIIHVQGLTMHGIGQWLARRLKCPYVITLHRTLTQRDRLRLDPQYGKTIVATSDAIRDSVTANCRVDENQVRVIRNGVIQPKDSVDRQILGNDHRAVVGTAGPLEAGQGLARFLRSIPRILASGPAPMAGGSTGPDFLIAGAGPDEQNLRRLAHDLGVQAKTTFVSNLYDFSESLSAMDIFCLPVERPGMGVTMLEAMARGVPVVVTNVGDVGQVVTDGQTGIIVPPSDEDAIVRAVTGLLQNVTKARQIGEAGRDLVRERYPLRNMLVDMHAVYRDAITP